MERLDLASFPLEGSALLEASAGTGKTYTVEHLVARLIREGKASLDRILIVTFTRAATRELRERIYNTLVREELQEAVQRFDEARIYTIHGFCSELLAASGLPVEIDLERVRQRRREVIGDLLGRGGALHRAQLDRLLRFTGGDPVAAIDRELEREREIVAPPSFEECLAGIEGVMRQADLTRDWELYIGAYTGLVTRTGEVKQQANVERFLEMMRTGHCSEAALEQFVEEGCVLLERVARGKRKARSGELELEHPWLLDWLETKWAPWLESAGAPLSILARVASEAQREFEQVMEEEELLTYEALLRRSLLMEPEPFDAVIVDEFQDTDPLQWRLFRQYIGERMPLILVGDPKQSIYAFRSADIYTYLEARGEVERSYSLGTNYRSTPSLVGAINRLFEREGLFDLPGAKLPYHPVAAGIEEETDISKGGALQFLIAEQEEALLATFVEEIGGLEVPREEIAILVKDRFQAARVRTYLQEHGIAAQSSRGVAPGHSEALQPLREVVEALLHVGDRNRLRIALRGRILEGAGAARLEQLQQALKGGFAHFFETLMREGVAQRLLAQEGGAEFVEELYGIAAIVAGSDRPLLEQFAELAKGEEVDGSARLFPEGAGGAVQLLTTFGSKGLEYRVVFALGTGSAPSRGGRGLTLMNGQLHAKGDVSDEVRAEQMRLLYVALTRARERLYVCVLDEASPAARLSREGFVVRELTELEAPRLAPPEPPQLVRPDLIELTFPERHLESFSSLAISQPSSFSAPHDYGAERTVQNLPAGPETGILVHKLLEQMPVDNLPALVQRETSGTPFSDWQEVLVEMVQSAWTMPLDGFCLADVDRGRLWPEMEFRYGTEKGEITGVIDLFFEHGGKIYLLDWKTNWLPDYSRESLEQAMQHHNYFLQMELYLQALGRYLNAVDPRPLSDLLGGVFYLFVRGGLYHQPLGGR